MKSFPQQAPKAIILDMDGTVVQHIDQRLINTAEWLDDRLFNITSAISRILQRDSKGQPLMDEEYYETRRKPLLLGHRALHKLRRKDLEKIVQPSDNVKIFLETLQQSHTPVGLASNGLGKGYGVDVLEAFSLTKYFTATIFRENIRKSKPHPESILMAIRDLDIELHQEDVIWYIGDRRKDIKAAMRANKASNFTIIPIAYTDDAAIQIPKEHLSDEYIIKSFSALNELYLSLT